MIKIDELEDSLDKKAEEEYEKLLVDFEEAVKNCPNATLSMDMYFCRGEFSVGERIYSKYSELSLRRLVTLLEREGWPVKKLLTGHSDYEIQVLPGAELKRRAREKSRRGYSTVGSIVGGLIDNPLL